MTESKTLRAAVDRREGQTLVIVDDAGTKHDVPIAELPKTCRSEGAVLDVPYKEGKPQWAKARRNHAEEQGRLREAGEAIVRLRKKDPGGDVSL